MFINPLPPRQSLPFAPRPDEVPCQRGTCPTTCGIPCLGRPGDGCTCTDTWRTLLAYAYGGYRKSMCRTQRRWLADEYMSAIGTVPAIAEKHLLDPQRIPDDLLAGMVVIARLDRERAERDNATHADE